MQDERSILVPVPKGKHPGETFYVRPPALMVKAPEGVQSGQIVSFCVRGGNGDNKMVECFHAKIPETLHHGYFVARLLRPHDQDSFDFIANAIRYVQSLAQ